MHIVIKTSCFLRYDLAIKVNVRFLCSLLARTWAKTWYNHLRITGFEVALIQTPHYHDIMRQGIFSNTMMVVHVIAPQIFSWKRQKKETPHEKFRLISYFFPWKSRNICYFILLRIAQQAYFIFSYTELNYKCKIIDEMV